MHYVYPNDPLNHNRYGFTAKNNTTDTAMAVQEFAEEGLRQGLLTIIVSLDLNGASRPLGGRVY